MNQLGSPDGPNDEMNYNHDHTSPPLVPAALRSGAIESRGKPHTGAGLNFEALRGNGMRNAQLSFGIKGGRRHDASNRQAQRFGQPNHRAFNLNIGSAPNAMPHQRQGAFNFEISNKHAPNNQPKGHPQTHSNPNSGAHGNAPGSRHSNNPSHPNAMKPQVPDVQHNHVKKRLDPVPQQTLQSNQRHQNVQSHSAPVQHQRQHQVQAAYTRGHVPQQPLHSVPGDNNQVPQLAEINDGHNAIDQDSTPQDEPNMFGFGSNIFNNAMEHATRMGNGFKDHAQNAFNNIHETIGGLHKGLSGMIQAAPRQEHSVQISYHRQQK